jgi:small GTP-binding protein
MTTKRPLEAYVVPDSEISMGPVGDPEERLEQLNDLSARGHLNPKIIIVGPPGAGKTTLISTYIHGSSPSRSAATHTLGCDFRTRLQTVPNTDGDNTKYPPFNLQLWDIAGEESAMQMTTVFAKNTAGVVIVVDVGLPDQTIKDNLKSWRSVVEKIELENGARPPILVALNKSDEKRSSIKKLDVLKYDIKALDVDGWFETSDTVPDTIASLFASMTLLIAKTLPLGRWFAGPAPPTQEKQADCCLLL